MCVRVFESIGQNIHKYIQNLTISEKITQINTYLCYGGHLWSTSYEWNKLVATSRKPKTWFKVITGSFILVIIMMMMWMMIEWLMQTFITESQVPFDGMMMVWCTSYIANKFASEILKLNNLRKSSNRMFIKLQFLHCDKLHSYT